MKALKWYRELNTGKGRQKYGFFIIEGVRAIQQLLSLYPETLHELVISDTFATDLALFSRFRKRFISNTQFRSMVTSTNPQGIAGIFSIPEESYSSSLPLHPGKRIVLLENVQDPGNVGTIIRCAAAFDFNGVVLSGESADPFSPKAVQASAGALLTPWIRRHHDYRLLVKRLKEEGFCLACADVNGCLDVDFNSYDGIIIALGNEGAGLSDSILDCADIRYTIPMNSNVIESLNVAVSGAISLFSVYRRCTWNV